MNIPDDVYTLNDLLWVFYLLKIDQQTIPRNSFLMLKTVIEEMRYHNAED